MTPDTQETETDTTILEIVTDRGKLDYLHALQWLDTIPYFHKKRREEIAALPINEVAECFPGIKAEYAHRSDLGHIPSPGWVYSAFKQKWQFDAQPTEELPPASQSLAPAEKPQNPPDASPNFAAEFQALLISMKKPASESLKETLAVYCQAKGIEYVKWCILYANERAKKNYAAFLKEALANNWADDWQMEMKATEERKAILEEQRRKEAMDNQRRARRTLDLEAERAAFREQFDALDMEVKKKLWERARRETPWQSVGWDGMMKFKFCEMARIHLNSLGANFSNEVTGDLRFACDLALEKRPLMENR